VLGIHEPAGTVGVPHYLLQSFLSFILKEPNSLAQQRKQKSSLILQAKF